LVGTEVLCRAWSYDGRNLTSPISGWPKTAILNSKERAKALIGFYGVLKIAGTSSEEAKKSEEGKGSLLHNGVKERRDNSLRI
ncbi:hypothetical protein HAX54_040421, partial [Datura stramonium]|nr:hypothetical protein [Datura stramonium]